MSVAKFWREMFSVVGKGGNASHWLKVMIKVQNALSEHQLSSGETLSCCKMASPVIFCGYADIQLFLRYKDVDIDYYNMIVHDGMKIEKDYWLKKAKLYSEYLQQA